MLKFSSDFPTGVMVRSIGIAPEKALKMVAWEGGMALVNYAFPNSSKVQQWMFAGSLAGAATTIIGKLHTEFCQTKYSYNKEWVEAQRQNLMACISP